VELGPRGVRVNCLVGGLVHTDALDYLKEGEAMLQEAARLTPLGRVADPVDLAPVAAFLCSDEAHWVTGQCLIADGGLSLL